MPQQFEQIGGVPLLQTYVSPFLSLQVFLEGCVVPFNASWMSLFVNFNIADEYFLVVFWQVKLMFSPLLHVLWFSGDVLLITCGTF